MRFIFLALSVILVSEAGCADPIRQGATAALKTASQAVVAFEAWDRQHKADMAASVMGACKGAAVGPARDLCVSEKSAPIRKYIDDRKPVLEAIDGLAVSTGMLKLLVQTEGKPTADMSAFTKTLTETITKVVTLVSKLEGGVK